MINFIKKYLLKKEWMICFPSILDLYNVKMKLLIPICTVVQWHMTD